MTNEELKSKLADIAQTHRVSVEFDSPQVRKNEGASAGSDEIMLGEFDETTILVAAFFHELGHCLAKNQHNIRIENEIRCWKIGFEAMVANGFEIKNSQIMFCLECLAGYAEYEYREYTESALLRLKSQIKEKLNSN